MRDLRVGRNQAPVAPADGAAATPTRAQQAVLGVAVVMGVVLRWWDVGGPPATFDESFSGSYSHLPLGQIPAALRADDAHPPLDYVIKHFFGSMGDTFALRLPSAVFGCLTLVVVVWWMRRRGWFGVAVVALTALSPFQLLYAHEARMYALAILCGTVVAAATESWLQRAARRTALVVAAALLVALLDVSTGLLLAGALMLVPGLRRDRQAWWWRASVAAAVAIWAAVWGLAFLHQAGGNHSDWIPYTSVTAVRDTLGQFLTMQTPLAWVGAALLVVGAVVLVRQDQLLGRIWLLLFLAPLVVSCVVGLRVHFLLTRTLATSAWAAPLAVAALIEWARRRDVLMGVLAAVLVGVVMVRSIPLALDDDDGSAAGVRAVATELHPGDAVAAYPSWLWPLLVWNDGAPRRPSVPPGVARAAPGTFVYVKPGAPFDGRLWVLEPAGYTAPLHPLPRCGPPAAVGTAYSLVCYRVPSGP